MPRHALTPLEITRVRAQTTDTPAGLRDRAIIALAYGCGMRTCEIIAADADDLDFDGATILVRTAKQRGKRRERTLPLPPLAQTDLAEYLARGRPRLAARARPLILPDFRGQPSLPGVACRISPQSIRSRIGRCFALAGVDGSMHALRHAYATHILAALVAEPDALRRVQPSSATSHWPPPATTWT